MLNIPELTGLFEPQPYKPPVNALENNLSTVAALQDPSGTLERMQAELVAKATADIKLDDVDYKYKQLALDSLANYQKKRMDMLRSNKKFNRLDFGAEQLLDDEKNYKDMILGINQMKSLTEDYKKTLTQVHNDVAKGIITAEDYKQFEDQYNTMLNSAVEKKSIGDLPIPHAVYNNYLAGKPYDWATMTKDLKAGIDGMKPQKVVDKEGNERYNVERLDPTPIVDSMFDYNQKYRNFWIGQAGGDPNAARKMAQEYGQKYAVDNRTWGGTAKVGGNTVNNYGNSKTVQIDHVLDGNKVVWDFPKKDIPYTKDKVPGYLTAVYNKNGKWYGEFSIDEMVDSPNKKTFDINNQKVPNRFGNDVYEVELDASDYSKVMAAGYRLDEPDKYKWDELKQQRQRTSKAKGASKTEADKYGL